MQKSEETFEQQLLNLWRETINTKKQKEIDYWKEKKRKGNNNKNLMFLTSEIMKKERTRRVSLNVEIVALEK